LDQIETKLTSFINSKVGYEKIDLYLNVDYLKWLHAGLTDKEAIDLLNYSRSMTIAYKSCYGDGSKIYPQWLTSKMS